MGTAQELSSDTRQDCQKKAPNQCHGGIRILTAHDQLIIGNLSIKHEAVTDRKHAKVHWEIQGIQRDKSTENPATRLHRFLYHYQPLSLRQSALFFTCFKKL